MTSNGPATTDRWAVSTRTSGAVLTAGVALPAIRLGILGIPQGFTPVEIESWLRDLAGVALETSRNDQRPRPIPALLHHALTGLLFSQTELWSHTGRALPCSAVFVDGANGAAFGWVGSARVMLLVNGEPFEPQWVIVRDETGHEALSAMLPSDAHVLLTLEYRPKGEDGSATPASIDAEFGVIPTYTTTSVATTPVAITTAITTKPSPTAASAPTSASATAPVASTAPMRPPGPAIAPSPMAAALPTEQPGLAPDPATLPLDQPNASQSLPSTHHASGSTFAMPRLPSALDVPSTEVALRVTPSTPPPGEPTPDQLPVAPSPPRIEPVAATHEGAVTIVADAATSEPLRAEGSPAAVWAPGSQSPEATSEPVTPPTMGSSVTSRRPEPGTRDLTPQDETRTEESGHPVGRWLSKVLGFGRRAPHPAPKPTIAEPPLSSYDALLGVDAPVTPAAESTPAQGSLALPSAPIDIAEPSPLPATAGMSTPSVVMPAPFQRGSLAPAGLAEILGKATARPLVRPVEGLTGVSAPSGPLPASSGSSVTPDGPGGTPPYPMLDIDVPREVTQRPVVIDHEPIGAAESFGIPPVPERELAPPVQPRDIVAAPRPTAVPTVTPTAGVAPPSTPPRSIAPESVAPEPPEPPADFLAEFAASMQTVEPTTSAPSSAPPSAMPATPSGPPVLRVTPTLKPTPVGQQSVAPSPVTPPVPPPPAAVPGGPPASAPVGPPSRPTMAFLRVPTLADPVPVVAAEQSSMMREIPLPSRSAEMRAPRLPSDAPVPPTPAAAGSRVESDSATEAPDGMLLAQAATPMPPGMRSRLASAWPAPEDLETTPTPVWRKPWAIGVFVAVLFGVGWLLGHSQTPDNDIHGTPVSRALRSVGLGGARFAATIDSDPPGAWIAVDGKDVARRTPSTIELAPGEHKVTLSMPDLGSVQLTVRGQNGQKVKVNEPLHGSLEVSALDPALPVKVSLDGQPLGWLPASIAKLPPGLHELQFNGPNMQPWAQQVSIPIRKTATLVARPMMSPATGVVQVQASMNDDSGTSPLNGAAVFIDGEIRGSTPLTLELPRGPHSLRVSYQGESAPVQVIDLPGGNRRFAAFQFGLDSDLPPLRLQAGYAVLPAKRVNTISATLDGLSSRDIRESFLHVKGGDGLWRRIQMTIQDGPRGAVLSGVFPNDLFDTQGRSQWYVSASTTQGDEFYTEMQRSSH